MNARRRRRATRDMGLVHTLGIEPLESRTLFSFSIGGITIPDIPGLPNLSISSLTSLLTLGGFKNSPINLGSLSSYGTLNPADQWWLSNTGQTLSHHSSGPATGTADADIDAVEAWNITQGLSNVVVAVLDTGIDTNNSALMSHVWTNPKETAGDGIDNDGNGKIDDVHGWNFLGNNANVSDNFVHGTATASAILSVAPGISVLPVEIGRATGAADADVIKGINYIIALKKSGVNIAAINASYISFSVPSQGLIDAVKNAGANGILFVAAAGNAGLNLEGAIPSFLQGYISKYLPSNLIFVAATDNQDHMASFSDYGKHIVAVGAPGVDMTLPIPGGVYATLSGTSFAGPMVSAIAALLKSRVPSATMGQIKNAILNSGDAVASLSGKTITGRRVNALKALNYILGQQLPTGAVTTLNSDVIEGWAFDANLGTMPASVKVSIDGVMSDAIDADIPDADLLAKLGSTDHGFSFEMPELGYGKHLIKVYGVDTSSGKMSLLKQGTVVINDAPTGALETAVPQTVTGWAQDGDTPDEAAKVKLYVDGKVWATGTANLTRDDLVEELGSADHGYSFKLKGLVPGIHKLDVYAVDTLSGEMSLVGSTVISTNSPPTGDLESATGTTLTGWAFDLDSGASAIQVMYAIDRFAPVIAAAGVSRPDLLGTLGSKNHGFSIALPQLAAGEHSVTVWALDPKSKVKIEIGTESFTVSDPEGNLLPVGAIETATTTEISGWAFDASAPESAMKMRIDVDGVAGATFMATAARDDLTESLGHGGWGFSRTLNLKPGQHRVDVYTFDNVTGKPLLLSRQIVGVATPTGAVDTATATKLTGWAWFGGPGTANTQIRIDVDGMIGALYTTNLKRADHLATTGSGNFGFSVNTPALLTGDHTMALWYINPLTLDATQVGTTVLSIA